MKALSIVLIVLCTLVIVGLSYRYVQGEPIFTFRLFSGLFWLFSLTLTCCWNWRSQFRAPWVLLLGVIFLLLGTVVLGSFYENFHEIKDMWYVDISIATFVFLIGILIVYYSKILHSKNKRKWK